MRTIQLTLHPLSALVGAALLGVVLLTASAVQSPSPQRVAVVNPLSISGLPTPQEAVQIVEGSPLTVPPGKLFVLTALGTHETDSNPPAELYVDNVLEVSAVSVVNPGTVNNPEASTSIVATPPGFAVAAGRVVDVRRGDSTPDGRAWGYLTDA